MWGDNPYWKIFQYQVFTFLYFANKTRIITKYKHVPIQIIIARFELSSLGISYDRNLGRLHF